MIVFKTFLKVLNKCKAPILMYTVFLIFFGAFRMETSDSSMDFVASKPDIYIVNSDEYSGITKSLVDYMSDNCNVIDLPLEEEKLNDALFYRDVNFILYIPKNYRNDFLNQKNPEIQFKSTSNYQASLAEMMLERFLKVANIYNETFEEEDDILEGIEETLAKEATVEITSKLDTEGLSRVTFYYNFMNYCLLAGCIYVICLILSSFKEEKILKRTIISSMNYKEYNRKLLLSNSLFAFLLWAFYVLLSFLLLGNIMFTSYGLFYILNSFVFTFFVLVFAFFLGTLFQNKNAINGIVNVVALGSSFLCGAFVPMEYLPDFVLSIAHVLPSYWFIKTNELLKTIEVFNKETLSPIFFNMGILILFSIIFIVFINVISKKKRKIN